jgi:endonuclease/exonuclease/phosphatase family metal-dependent hydrolase
MRIVTYNIQFSRGKDLNYDLERIARTVEGADIIGLQEVERNWPHLEMADQPGELARLLPDYYWVYGAGLDIDGSSRQPDGSVVNRRQQVGNMILSKTPIIATRNHLLPKIATLDFPNDQRVALEGIVETSAGALRVYVTHLSPRYNAERRMQIEAIMKIVRDAPTSGGVTSGPNTRLHQVSAPNPPMPHEVIILGDFNLEPHEAEYDLLCGEIDPVYGRIAQVGGFVDAWVQSGNDIASGVTCPMDPTNDTFHDCRLDYGFVSGNIAQHVRTAWIDNDAQGSDHQPFWFELDL